jgi:hypothetical protein
MKNSILLVFFAWKNFINKNIKKKKVYDGFNMLNIKIKNEKIRV